MFWTLAAAVAALAAVGVEAQNQLRAADGARNAGEGSNVL